MSDNEPDTPVQAPPPLPTGAQWPRSLSAADSRCLATAAREGWREIILSDANFHDWPLGERAVVESLQAWAQRPPDDLACARTYDWR